jgi:glycine C-acetyltransferase/8-amino-7-oxononanoate synthase
VDANFLTDLAARTRELRDQGLYKNERILVSPQNAAIRVEGGREVLNFCANNYLGLADHPRVIEAARAALEKYGFGMASVRFICGTQDLHKTLEARLSRFLGTDDTILYSSCFDANGGLFETVLGEEDAVITDALNHASIIDGCRLSRAEVFVYDHLDVDHLSWGIGQAEGRGALIVTDGVFSMDGDVAPLAELVALARRHRMRLVVDEAHGTGALGPGGRGALAEAGLEDEVDVIIGTLGKSLGSYGAFAACDREMTDYLLNTARTFIFSTALPPPAAAGALAALELLESKPELVSRLRTNSAALRAALADEGFDVAASRTQIIPLVLGDPDTTVRACELALERGVFAQAIRPPTVPPMTSRLRLAVMASHRAAELRDAARVLAEAVRAAGVEPRSAAVAELSAPASGVFDVERPDRLAA